MTIPTEPIESTSRPPALVEAAGDKVGRLGPALATIRLRVEGTAPASLIPGAR